MENLPCHTEIILFRHLPTLDDVSDIYTGEHAAVPFSQLDELKIREIVSELNEFLSTNSSAQLISSDNPRGRSTLQFLAENGLDTTNLSYTAALNNIRQPAWSGLSQKEVQKTALYRNWHDSPTSIRFPNGESLADVDTRIRQLLSSLDRPAILISHTTPMQVILCVLLGLSLEHIWRFKFDHYLFTYVLRNVLVRFNAPHFLDFDKKTIRS